MSYIKNGIELIKNQRIPVVTYSYNIIYWMLAEIKKTYSKSRNLINCHRIHHSRADIVLYNIPMDFRFVPSDPVCFDKAVTL